MTEKLLTANLRAVINDRSIPGLTYWNRLEGRPRADSFDRALRAEVRDALWMLSRQWQLGEFTGDDAASPITARVRVDTAAIGDQSQPLESVVEALPVPLIQGGTEVALDLRLLAGRYWLKLVAPLVADPRVRAQYVAAYPVPAPDPAEALIAAHPRAAAAYRATAGRMMDGVKLHAHLAAGGHASDGIGALAGHEAQADLLGERFVAWYARLVTPPATPATWDPARLEYQFSAGPLTAAEYAQGALDWYHVDLDPSVPAPAVARTQTMLPTAVTFHGMPNTRWWAFEDGRTNFGAIAPDTTDLAKLLLIEFGLVYANDWLQVPVTVPAGALATIRGLAVTDVFGDRTWVTAAAGDEWGLFRLSPNGDRALANLPAATQILDGPPHDDVTLTRDEMANMVWAIEKVLPLPSGVPIIGADASNQTRAFYGAPADPPATTTVRYQVMSSVPEHWIPMVPAHRPDDVREIQLQRAAMPRLVAGLVDGDAPPALVRPRTWLLRPGLDAGDAQPYFVHEEQVPRSGVRVMRGYRRARGPDGRVWVWIGARKMTGRGEGTSGLAFDQLI